MIGKDYRPLTTLEAKSSNVSNIDYGDNPNWVQARQYEDGLRQVFVEITNEDGSPYDLTGANVLFEGILPDNEHKILDNSHAVFYEDPTSGKFRFDLPAAAFAVAGQYKQAFFRITKGYQNVATLEFKLEVLADMVISGLMPSDYISPLEDFLTEVKAAESKTLAELKDTQNKTLDDIKANGDKALATLQDLEIQNVANLKKIVDDKVNEINNLMAITNSSNQSVLSELTNAKNLLVDLQTKIKEDGLFTKYDADKMVEDFRTKTQELTQRVSDAVAQANTLVENKIAQMDNGVHGYPSADAIKQAYPTGAQGIFVAVDTGHQWYYINGQWTDGGAYQAVDNDAEVKDGRKWADGTISPKIGDAIRDQIKRIRLDENKAHKDIQNDLYSRIEILPKVTYGKYDTINIIDVDGNTIENLGEDVYTFDFDKINRDTHEQELLKQFSTQKFKHWGQLPVLELNNLPQALLDYDADKSVKVKNIPYYFLDKDLSGVLESVKIQGNTSVSFPKKNYTLKFNTPVVLHENWGAHTKYVIKSNFNDASQIRNLLAAKTWGNIIKSRLPETLENINLGDDILTDKDGNTIIGSSDRVMAIGKNYGAIDGYPITLFINGNFHGIYNLCIPKDDWMADMSHSTEAIVSADQDFAQSQAQFFKGTPDFNGDFEIKWTKNDEDWVKPSIINAVNAVKADYDSDEAYYNNINEYIDVDSAIDYFIFCALLDNTDGVGKNYLLDTFDKKRWYFTAYDMDNVIGIFKTWNGTALSWRDYSGFYFYAERHRMFEVILKHMKDRLIKRYKFLRNNALSFATLYNLTMDLYGSIPQYAFNAEFARWPLEPTTSIRTADQIIFWLDKRLQFLDDEIKQL